MKYSKFFKKMVGLMLASVGVASLAFASVASAASAQETLEASGVTRINVTSNAKTVNIEASADNDIHVSSAVRAVKSGNAVTIIFMNQAATGTIQIPSGIDPSLTVRSLAKAESISIKNISLKDIQINTSKINININDVTVPSMNVSVASGDISVNAKGLKSAYVYSKQGNVAVQTDATDLTNITAKSVYGNVEVTTPNSSNTRSASENTTNDKVTAYSVQGKAEVKSK